MVEQFAAPPINPVISIKPVTVSAPNRDATTVQTQLAALPPGTIVEGFVLNRDQQGNPILRTPVGDLQVQSDVFLKTGSQVVIRVDATVDTRARIVTIDGVEPQIYAAQNAKAGLTQDTIATSAFLKTGAMQATVPTATHPVIPGTSTMPLQQPLPLQQAATLQGMLLNATPLSLNANPLFAALPGADMPVPAGLMKLQAGAALKVMLLDLRLPNELHPTVSTQALTRNTRAPDGPSAAFSPQVATPSGEASNTHAASSVALPNSAISSREVAPAAMASVQAAKAAFPLSPPDEFQSIAPRGPVTTMAAASIPSFAPGPPASANYPQRSAHVPSSSASASATPVADAISGLVIGHEADGGNIVQTRLGMLKIYTPAPLPMHTGLTLEVKPETKPTAPQAMPTALPVSENAETVTSITREWTHLSETISWLSRTDQFASHDFNQMMPHIGPRLTSGLLFFLAAVKGGDLKQWIGSKASNQLEAKLPELAAKLKSDMVQLQQLLLHSPLDQWSGVMIPLMHGDQIDYAKLYLRDESPEEGKQSGKGKEQRFILEIEFSHLGEMQFDGFVRQTSPKKQFDLIIRTSKALTADISSEIRTRFEQAIGATGYNGYLGFQQGAQHFVRPLVAKPGQGPQTDHTILA